MSRVGKKPIHVPKGAKVAITNGTIAIEGPKGKLEYLFPERFKVELKDEKVTVLRPSDSKPDRSTHGLIRSLINNMLIGVTQGYSKELELSGVGFKAQMQGKNLSLTLSQTHPILYPIPSGITVETPKLNQIIVKGVDKAKVGEVAAHIRFYYEPEPYKGKGIKYAGEVIRRKAGKTVAGTGA
ncbi:MAG: 50S ribosomal protein L6 [Candidatus Omnitrophota bacterium]